MKNGKEIFGERVGIVANLVGGQAELARRTGISTVSISSYMKGESDPSRERLVAMAEAANVSLFWLATGEGQMRSGRENTLSDIETTQTPHLCLVDASGNIASSWEAPEPSSFDYVPMVETQLSAGAGNFVLSENIEGYYAFRKSWLLRIASSVKSLVLMRVQGRSMDPTIQDGDTVMIDTGRQAIKEGLLYALRFGSTVMIKRLSFRPGGRILVISDNRQEYDPFETDLSELHVIGQIVFFCRTFVPE